jgi:hypothetical protein
MQTNDPSDSKLYFMKLSEELQNNIDEINNLNKR